MIVGAHVTIYSTDADADREFFRDVLDLETVDAGHGWLIFKMPPSEATFHPHDRNDEQELFFMSDDLAADVKALCARGVECLEASEEPWGTVTRFELPVAAR